MMRAGSSAFLLALATLITLAACAGQPAPTPSAPAAAAAPAEKKCTSEAKLCPDGSGVGRTGPNCEFAACPGQ